MVGRYKSRCVPKAAGICQLGAELRRPPNKSKTETWQRRLPLACCPADGAVSLAALRGGYRVLCLYLPGSSRCWAGSAAPPERGGCVGSGTGLAGEEQPEWVVQKEGRTPKERESLHGGSLAFFCALNCS